MRPTSADSILRFSERLFRRILLAGLLLASLASGALAQSGNASYVFTHFAGPVGGFGNADGPAQDARFYAPSGVALDLAGNIYVADEWNSTIRKISPNGIVTTLAGTAGQIGSADGSGSRLVFSSH